MNKYRVLIMGKNNAIVDDFFTHTIDVFEVLSSSVRYEDVTTHLEICKPQVLVVCPDADTEYVSKKITELKHEIRKHEILVTFIGDESEVNALNHATAEFADLLIYKPISIEGMKEKIVKALEDIERAKREAELAEEERVRNELAARRRHILVIDDDALMLKTVKAHLHDEYDVATALNSKLAYKFLESKHTDLILLDYEMPDEKGPEVMEKIREMPGQDEVPIIFLTGVTDKDLIQKALVKKPQGYLLKPIEKDRLLETVKKALGN